MTILTVIGFSKAITCLIVLGPIEERQYKGGGGSQRKDQGGSADLTNPPYSQSTSSIFSSKD